MKTLSITSRILLITLIFSICAGGYADVKLRSPTRIAVLTYNIYHGEDANGNSNLDAVARIINSLGPDLVALQEVDNKTTRAKGLDLTAELSKRTGMKGVFGKAMDYAGGEYGEAVLSHHAILDIKNNPLPHSPNAEPRTALEVHIELPTGDRIVFVGTHLDHLRDQKNRMMQASRIMELYENSGLPIILAGDLNAVPGSDPINLLSREWSYVGQAAPKPTAPSVRPRRKIDYIMYKPKDRWRILETRVIDEKVASDHCPVFTVLELLPESEDEPFDYFRNSWTVIGLKDYANGTRINPDNQLVINDSNQKPSRVLIRFGRQLTPLSEPQTKRLMNGWLPVVSIAAEDGQVMYEFTLWATPLPSVKNWQKAFDWPIEGENFLNWILVKVTNKGQTTAEAKLKVERSGPSSSTFNAFAWSLAPGETAEAVTSIPFSPLKEESDFAREDAKLWLNRTVQYWRGVMARAMQIRVPCKKATQALLASHVYQLIANDHGEVHPGEGFYDEFYIRDAAYQLMELEEAGLIDIAQRAMESFLGHQRPDGRFESQKNQLDANGQACWALWQFYKITGDQRWLTKVYPRMRQAVDWTLKANRQAPVDSPFSGVLPNAPADGEYLWDGKYHIVGYDFWNLRGLLCTADAARALGRIDEAKELLREAEKYRNAINAAWKQTRLDHFPPSWEKAGTHWGNTETLWPTELFDTHDPRVTALISEVRENYGGGFIEGTIQWLGHANAIHPYMSAYTTMASLIRGEHEQVVEDFYWYLLHSTATNAFPEGVYHKRRIAWNDTIPHTLGASNYAIMLRHMLIHERSDELHLLMAIPDWWLAEGNEIRLERAPTHFGPMNLIVTGTKKGVQVEFDPPRRQPPKRTFLYLPKSRPLIKSLKGVEVVLRPGQKKHWDFPAVLRLYRQHAVPLIE